MTVDETQDLDCTNNDIDENNMLNEVINTRTYIM